MNEIVSIINSLRNTSGTNDKLQILKNNKDNELLKKVLEYTYNPFKKYGLSEKTIVPITGIDLSKWIDIFDMLDELSDSNINDHLRREVGFFLSTVSRENDDLHDLYIRILLKDLKIGLNSKSINKVWKGLIPSFDVMLAHSYFKDNNGEKFNGEFIVTTKLDGLRIVGIKENNIVKFYSRQGQLIEGLVEIEEDFKLMPNGIVIDGELLLRNDKQLSSDDLYRATMKIARKDGIKKDLQFHAFDYVDLEQFKKGIDKTPCIKRKELLHSLVSNNNFNTLVEVKPIYIGEDKNKVIELLSEAKLNNQEGVMVNISNSAYECKRSKGILKVKQMQSCDIKCLRIEKGEGKYSDVLGKIICDYKGYEVGVGSGFSDSDRSYYINNPNEIIGKIVEIQYFEESTNQKDKNAVSLRFPVFKCVREEGKEVSYN